MAWMTSSARSAQPPSWSADGYLSLRRRERKLPSHVHIEMSAIRYRRRSPGRTMLLLLVIPAGSLLLVIAAANAANIPVVSPGSCGRDQAGVPVLAEFDVPNGPALLERVPLGISPEISEPGGPLHDGPLHVVVFRGPHLSVPVHRPLRAPHDLPPPTDVVCVIRPDGDTYYYSSVDLTTFVP